MSTESCRDLLASLADFVDGKAPLPRRLVLRWHLWHCADCRRYRSQLLGVVEAARQVGTSPSFQDGQALSERVFEALGVPAVPTQGPGGGPMKNVGPGRNSS